MPSADTRSPPAHTRRDSLARGSAARLVSWRHTCPHPVHRYRQIASSRVGRQPSGSCASSRVTVSGSSCTPAASAPALGAVIGLQDRQDRAIGLQTLADHDQAELIQAAERGQVRAAEGSVRHDEVFQMGGVGTSILGRPRHLPGTDAPATIQPATTPSTVKSPIATRDSPREWLFLSTFAVRSSYCSRISSRDRSSCCSAGLLVRASARSLAARAPS